MGGFNWDPLSWIEDAGRAVTGLTKPVQRWVIKEVKAAGDLLEKDIQDVAHVAHRDVADVFGDLEALERRVERIVVSAGGDVGEAISAVVHESEVLASSVISGLKRLIDTTWAHADNLYHDALKSAEGDVAWAEKHVIDPGLHDLHVAVTDAEKAAEKAADATYHDLIKPIEHDAAEALARVVNIGSWIDHSAYDAVKLVEGAAEFLEAVAAHPAAAAQKAIAEWEAGLTLDKAVDTASVANTYANRLVKSMEDLFIDG
jgi:hypothetical protein